MAYKRYPKINDASSAQNCGTTLSSPAYFDALPRNALDRTGKAVATRDDKRAWYRRQIPNMQRAAHPRPYKISIHADMMKVKTSDIDRGVTPNERKGGGTRGIVRGFSRASRKRMIEFMASVRNTGSMLFLTMTFDDSVIIRLDDELTAMFEAFRHRFERQYPGWRALWRKEYQDRKSGDYAGLFVPHFHLIIFTGVDYAKHEQSTLAEEFRAWGAEAWQEITGTTDPNHLIYGFDVSPVRSRKHAYSYVGKYVAKQEDNGIEGGRRWGRVGKFDTSVSETFRIDEDEYIVFRRLIKRWLRNRAGKLPDNASAKQRAKHQARQRANRSYAKRYAGQPTSQGCTVFGLGDTTNDNLSKGLFPDYWQFVYEARRQVAQRREDERGLSD